MGGAAENDCDQRISLRNGVWIDGQGQPCEDAKP